jgi:hypothetical protein
MHEQNVHITCFIVICFHCLVEEHKTGNEKQLKALSKQTKRVARAGGSAELVEG